MAALYELLFRASPHEAEFSPAASGACQDHPFDIPLLELIESCSVVVSSQRWLWHLLGGFMCSSISDAAYDQPLATC